MFYCLGRKTSERRERILVGVGKKKSLPK